MEDDDLKGGGLKRGRGTKKIPVVAVVNREEKKIFARGVRNFNLQKTVGV
jgi:hypothetical protein